MSSAADGPVGSMRLFVVYGHLFVFSPDCTMWLFPTLLAVLLAGASVAVAWASIHTGELILFTVAVLFSFYISAQCVCTDPGIYAPRRLGGEDPNAADFSLPLCKVCGHRRPFRAFHCYNCGVCVLEHDHHCGLVGACVGQRNLRYFVGYIGATCVCSFVAFFFMVRSLLHSSMWAKPSNKQQRSDSNDSGSIAAHIVVMIFVGNVALMLGGLFIYYLYLVACDYTRRDIRYAPGTRKTLCGSFHNCLWPPLSQFDVELLRQKGNLVSASAASAV